MGKRAPLTMIAFAPMIASETTRTLCRWYGVAYQEEDHLVGWAQLLTQFHGGTGVAPLVYGKGLRMTGPMAVVNQYDKLAAPTHRLLPDGPEQAGIKADWETLYGKFSDYIALYAYFHLLPARKLMAPIFAAPVPPFEAWLTPLVYPIMGWLIRSKLKITPATAQAAGEQIPQIVAEVDRRLADGRSFLNGERLTLGDIGFACSTAPLLQPTGYGTVMAKVSEMPPTIRDFIDTLRQQHPTTVAYVERVYAYTFSHCAPGGGPVKG